MVDLQTEVPRIKTVKELKEYINPSYVIDKYVESPKECPLSIVSETLCVDVLILVNVELIQLSLNSLKMKKTRMYCHYDHSYTISVSGIHSLLSMIRRLWIVVTSWKKR